MSVSPTTTLRLIRYYAGLMLFAVIFGYEMECPGSGISGPWVTPGSTCRSYYTCIGGRPLLRYCPINSFFNTETKTCGESGSCYEVICAGREDGKYLDPTESCTRSYWCRGGHLVGIGPVSDGDDRKRCPDVSESAARLIHKPNKCEDKLDGRYSLDDNCSGYFECANEVEVKTTTCPQGSSFNGFKCSKGLNQCTNICSGKDDGLYSDPTADCIQYVRCTEQRVVERLFCPADTAFNGHSCVPKDTFFCPGKEICKSLPDGFHLESCENYFKCERGKTLFSATCSQGDIFNGLFCVSENILRCRSSHFSKICLGKDGFHTNHTSRCTSYYHCRRDGVKIDFTCPSNHVFNGTVCVPEVNFKCPTKLQSCDDQADGYHLQTGSLCRVYYYCLNGNKIIYYCPKGTLYNGEKCVPASSYTCTDDLACNDLTGPCSLFS